MLAFPAKNVKWLVERKLYATLQENNEDSLKFIMRKLKLVNKLSINLSLEDKVDLILYRMLPQIQEKLEMKRVDTITEL